MKPALPSKVPVSPEGLAITLMSGDRPGVSGYYDLTPESPSGDRVVVFSFHQHPHGAGKGRVAIVDRDGSNLQLLGPEVIGISQNGAMQQWLDDDYVASVMDYTGEQRGTRALTVAGGQAIEFEEEIRMFNAASGLGLGFRKADDHPKVRSELYQFDFHEGSSKRLATLREIAKLHPVAKDMSRQQIDEFDIKHSKWSPDGKRFFVVMTNDYAFRVPDPPTYPRIKALMVADADGSNMRHLADFGHHPLWGPTSDFAYAFARNADQTQCLKAYPVDGDPYVLLDNIKGVHPSLSPDGRWLVTDRWTEATDDPNERNACIVLIDPKTGDEREIARLRVADTSQQTGCHPHPAWDRAGKRVYFNSTDDGVLRMWAIDLE